MYPVSFGSDNHSGAHPKILEAIIKCNDEYLSGYGEEAYTEAVLHQIESLFGEQAQAFFVMTGTGANVIALQSIMSSFNAVFCAQTSHINVDECGAVQKFTQGRLIPIPTPDGKLTPDLIKPYLKGRGDQHNSQPKVISISQSAEYGTVYSISEIRELCNFAHDNGMLIYIDGARLANALASLNTTIREMVDGVDCVSFGGTKNGMLFGEALVFQNHHEVYPNVLYYRKQAMQLLSKHRYLSAQFEAYLKDDLWLQNAQTANRMAAYLAKELQQIKEVTITQKVQANAVFCILPSEVIEPLQRKYHFYMWDQELNEARLMCSFNTTEDHVEAFLTDLKNLINR